MHQQGAKQEMSKGEASPQQTNHCPPFAGRDRPGRPSKGKIRLKLVCSILGIDASTGCRIRAGCHSAEPPSAAASAVLVGGERLDAKKSDDVQNVGREVQAVPYMSYVGVQPLSVQLEMQSARQQDALETLAVSLRLRFETGCTRGGRWRISQLKALRKMLVDNKDDICAALAQDLGKSRAEALSGEVLQVVQEIDDAVSNLSTWMTPKLSVPTMVNAGAINCVTTHPLGAVLVISAWNYPVVLLLAPVVGAIAAGNCVCIKPSEHSPATAGVMNALIPRYLDTSCFKVVVGGVGDTKALLRQKWDKVLFTGSTNVGREVMKAAAESLTPVVLELGGKSPVVVDESARVSGAAKRIVWAAMFNSGQTCVRPDYVLCHAKVYGQLVEALKKEIVSQFGQDPYASKDFGRIAQSHPSHIKHVAGIVRGCSEHIVCGGDVREEERYISPTILGFASDRVAFETSPAMKQEIFGPVLPVVAVPSIDEALEMIRAREHPLAAYLFTQSWESRRKFGEVEAGGIAVNDCILHMTEPDMPFGGRGPSGTGSYHGRFGFDAFSHIKGGLYKMPYTAQEFMRYAPIGPWKSWLTTGLVLRFPHIVKHLFEAARLAIGAGFLLVPIYLARAEHWALIWLAAMAGLGAHRGFEGVSRSMLVWWLTGK